jgi:uncharacterized tellurite resistance protein B-like protein
MLYHKIPLENGKTKLVELHEDEIVAYCPICDKEHQIDPEYISALIDEGGDFVGTNIYCSGCSKRRSLKVVK